MDRRTFVQGSLIGGTAAAFTGCKVMEAVAVGTGTLTEEEAKSLTRVGKAVAKTFQDFTPEQEYYVGRTVGANILQAYKPYNHAESNYYINQVGQSLALFSDVPETFGGYHFQILDSMDINAFAAPGGLIFVTRGMIKCCGNEDALAAVLAHEIAHVQLKHGLRAIKKSRITEAITILATEAAKNASGAEFRALAENFEGSISDITSKMINSGYSRSFEKEADLVAVTILERSGYSTGGMKQMLTQMEKNLKPGGKDFFKTHPKPAKRKSLLAGKLVDKAIPEVRTKRFATNSKNV